MLDVNMGLFLNEFAAKLFWPLAVAAMFILPIFGHFYNKLMDKLEGKDEHTSLYVALGNLVTIGIASIFSWKAALLFLILFMADGTPMIFGEFKRTERRAKKKTPRRKRIPYAANGRIDDATLEQVVEPTDDEGRHIDPVDHLQRRSQAPEGPVIGRVATDEGVSDVQSSELGVAGQVLGQDVEVRLVLLRRAAASTG